MPSIVVPDYAGGSLVNLVAEIESRLAGAAPSPPLHPRISRLIPEASTYVFVLFDGLGSLQLDHPEAREIGTSRATDLDAPFPSMTTVSLATVATGLPPSQHGLIGYQLWLPEVDTVVNTIQWTTLWGDPVDYDTAGFLPQPNLWERLTAAGIEPITVQPANFAGSSLTRGLYRGARFEGAHSVAELVEATLVLASVPGRLIFTYLPHVDFAAHVHGQESPEYARAMHTASWVWTQLAARLRGTAALVGSADHGHIDFPKRRRISIAKADHKDRTFYGDYRAMFVRGEGATLAEALPATWIPRSEMEHWWGPYPRHPAFAERAPDGILLADDDIALLHRHGDTRLIGNHGGLTEAERLIPLLIPER